MKSPDSFPQEQIGSAKPRKAKFINQYPPNSNACYHVEDCEAKPSGLKTTLGWLCLVALAFAMGAAFGWAV